MHLLKTNYYRLCLETHPDTTAHMPPDEQRRRLARFRLVQQAYQRLSNPKEDEPARRPDYHAYTHQHSAYGRYHHSANGRRQQHHQEHEPQHQGMNSQFLLPFGIVTGFYLALVAFGGDHESKLAKLAWLRHQRQMKEQGLEGVVGEQVDLPRSQVN